eukprot:CAMPEP_0172036948 /NCGR_PEP_ID=MMETSP1041-20130122/22453_1 /TAXON_ID=464988 /ORGANISM="Hemiselmis andersenii, Strain CCMP439" /LENGTH=61 /DNA_ID=CAMNT_0012694245 /DNA_START=35 /DNA_END=216 /DNA_ORIENTATION=+
MSGSPFVGEGLDGWSNFESQSCTHSSFPLTTALPASISTPVGTTAPSSSLSSSLELDPGAP